MKISIRHMWLYFIAINILVLSLAAFAVIPERMFIWQGQTTAIRLRERQLAIMEENLRRYEDHAALFSALQAEDIIIIQPAEHTGALLTVVRSMLYMRGLTEHEFHASEQASHYIGGRHIAETRATIMAGGNFSDISAFLHDLANHYRYLRLERIQISEEISMSRLWLIFSIYEEW